MTFNVRIETLLSPTWALLHHAGTFTNVHQDAEGYGVAGQVLGDRDDPQPKMWAVMTFRDTSVTAGDRKLVADRLSEICAYDGKDFDKKMWTDCEIEVLYLRPGDILWVFMALVSDNIANTLVAFNLLERYIWSIHLEPA